MLVGSRGAGFPLLVGTDGPAIRLERVPLVSAGAGKIDERWLQDLIHRNPDCLPIDEIEPALGGFVSICKELPTLRGSVDNLLMTPIGDIALVEAKLFRNPEARRQVLAQALDYATCLFGMTYCEFERAVLSGLHAPKAKPSSLYSALPEGDKPDEHVFIDAVAGNLRRGRAIILVVGDGIRSEAADLLNGLHIHARFGFTFALVELNIFRMPAPDDRLLVRPRTLARTVIVQRTIVETNGTGVVTTRTDEPVVPATLGSQSYWEALETQVPSSRAALERLLRAAEPLGVYPDFLRSMNLRWDRPGANAVNLGYVMRSGEIWTDAVASAAPRELARAYIDDLAATWGCDVGPANGSWTLRKKGKSLRLPAVLDRLDHWLGPIQRFLAAIQADSSSGLQNDEPSEGPLLTGDTNQIIS